MYVFCAFIIHEHVASMATNRTTTPQSFLERHGDLLGMGVVLLSVLLFFADALFTGKSFLAESDNVAFLSFVPYLDDAKASGEFPLWVPYIFSGMPSMASFLAAGDRSWDVLSKILFAIPRTLGEATGNDTWRLALWYAIYGWGVYWLMRTKKHDQLVAIFSAVAAIFSTFVIVWVMIGHSTKPVSMAAFPFILLAAERLRERFTLWNLFLLICPMIVLVSATHPQMMFYIGLGTVIYVLVELISRLASKESIAGVLRATGALAIAGTLALATHADFFLSTRDYTPYSTRGSAPLVQTPGQNTAQDGGNDYEYATNWSFSGGEIKTFFVPNWYGFGKIYDERGQLDVPYWGQMPFTDAANYMGIGVLLLALIGIFAWYRDPFVIFLTVMGALSLLLALGKYSPFVYDFFFHTVPGFNKFRAPQIALCLLQFAVPVLAGYGASTVRSWIGKSTPQTKKLSLVIAGATAVFLVAGFIGPAMTETSFKADVASALFTKYRDQVRSAADIPQEMINDRFELMSSDWKATGFIALCFGGLILAAGRGAIKPQLLMGALIFLTIGDLWRVAKRPYHPEKAKLEQSVFRKTDVVDFLQRDNGVFRIADFSRTPPNSWAYHKLEHVHGYSSAKLRVYQDMLDIAGPGKGAKAAPGNSIIANDFVWNLLNVKYLIADRPLYAGIQPAFTSQEMGLMVYENPSQLGRAWFVDSVVVNTNKRQVAEMVRDGAFDPRRVAIVDAAPAVTVAPSDSTATVQVVGRGNQHLTLKTKNTATNFLVVSEVFYPEWIATIDGQEVPTHRTDFFLRGVVVPPGSHTVEFKYVSPSFEQGRLISQAANGIAILVGALGIFFMVRDRRKGAVA